MTDETPYSREIEESIISLALKDFKYYLGDAVLEPEDFYIHRLRFIWEAILSMKRQGLNIDIVSIADELDRNGKLAEVGGNSYLAGLLNSYADGLSAENYVDQLHDYRARRDGIRAALDITQKAFDLANPFEIPAQIDQLQNLRWRDDQSGIREISQIADSLSSTIDAGFTAISTGISDLDRVLMGGLFEGLYVSAGSPSSGKTALWWAASQNIARSKLFSQPRVLFFSLEMKAEELLARTACGMVGVSYNEIRAGKKVDGTLVTQQERDSVKATAQTLGAEFSQRLVIVDKPCNIWDICRLIDLYGPDIVMVDHLNEIKRHDKSENVVWFGAAAKILKDKAKQKGIPLVLLHQLNRESSKENRPPILQDLKYCAEVEERADVVIMLDRPIKTSVPLKASQAQLDIYIRKYRNGIPNKMTTLLMNLSQQTFSSPPRP